MDRINQKINTTTATATAAAAAAAATATATATAKYFSVEQSCSSINGSCFKLAAYMRNRLLYVA